MGKIIQQKNGKTVVYTIGEDFNTLNAVADTTYIGVDETDNILKKKNPNGDIINLEESSDSRPYKVYTALLTQTGTDAPVATVLENTLGEVLTWVYFSPGYFYVQSPLFEQNKTFLSIQKDFVSLSEQVIILDKQIYYDGSDINGHYISIYTIGNGVAANGLLNYTAIEIRVYN
jgi:hypothetical protein